ncbi:MAG TPA: ankyrin repeat domain-containing protein [Thermoanaerobaculia bacterium]|nr:ankyrin repeat domain-containing protein [Thermoanaerobaculia bacterium]
MKSAIDDLVVAVRAGNHQEVGEILKRHPESARERDSTGATALHYATESGDRVIAATLLDAGADINARDQQFSATPAGWAIEYLRQRGALLGIEIEDARQAILNGDEQLVQRYLARFPTLREAIDGTGTPLKEHAKNSRNREIARLFSYLPNS